MKAKRLRKILFSSIFICFIYFFIRIGFEQDDPHPSFGENLDRNLIDSSKLNKRHRKFRTSSEEIEDYEIVNSIVSQATTINHDDVILQAFLKKVEEKPTTKRIQAAIKRRKRRKKRKKHWKNRPTKIKRKVNPNDINNMNQIKKDNAKNTAMKIGLQNVKNEPPKLQIPIPQLLSDLTQLKPEQLENPQPGDYGKAYNLPSDIPSGIKELVEEGWKKHQFNEYVSNLIPVNRRLLDFRSDYCQEIANNYKRNLPSVSVIIVFCNEAWSTLLRTIHSVINRTPDKLIREILLIDDYSDMPHLKSKLSTYIEKLDKVRLIRNFQREGLIRSRNRGATLAKSDILVFLDSHVECTTGWLEPLINAIALNNANIAVPVIEQIHDNTFEMIPRNQSNRVSLGGFTWGLQFKWFYMNSSSRKHPDAPISTPTMAGGLFAISAAYFKHVGMYDPGLEIWGGENLELSFKTWMCGGNIQMIPCSHIGHVFRRTSPYDFPEKLFMKRNSMRVAKVWMDDYIKFFKQASGIEDDMDYGDISERIKLRESLNCKDFSWYLKSVYPERTIPSEQIAYGQIYNNGYNKAMCLDGNADKFSSLISTFKCNGKGGTQYWEYNGMIYRDNHCLTYDGYKLFTKHCRQTDNQIFNYDPKTKQLILKDNKKCLALTEDLHIDIKKCDDGNLSQKWELEHLNMNKLKEAMKK